MTMPTSLALVSTDEQHRNAMLAALHLAVGHFSLTLAGPQVFGWKDRSIGAKATTSSGEAVWLRVGSELATWAYGESWDGNKDAAVIRGVRKPEVRQVFDWAQSDRWFRAEVMTYVAERPVSATPELHEDPGLPGSWWTSLRSSLDALSGHATARLHLSQQDVTRRLRQYFADRIDPVVDFWVTAHNDLHWNNLTRPGCYLLDWEGWGMAPAGYDAATLYCHSLLVPEVAARVYAEFAAELATPDGVRSQLLAVARMLDRSGHGDYPDLVVPLHELAGKLIGQ
jgi:hypothetical protein